VPKGSELTPLQHSALQKEFNCKTQTGDCCRDSAPSLQHGDTRFRLQKHQLLWLCRGSVLIIKHSALQGTCNKQFMSSLCQRIRVTALQLVHYKRHYKLKARHASGQLCRGSNVDLCNCAPQRHKKHQNNKHGQHGILTINTVPAKGTLKPEAGLW
jgi:hypothetical protein